MHKVVQFLTGLLGLLAGGALTVWFIWGTVKKAEDPGRLAMKWFCTAIIFGMILYVGGFIGSGGWGGPFIIVGTTAAFGVLLGIIWAPHLGAVLAKPLTSLYDGGDVEPEARPFYAIARAKQKRGLYQDALAAIRGQLERFPEDFEGWMLMAEIYANDLKDNANAQECIEAILRHESHAPKNIAFALNCSADWHLKLASDRDSARTELERIMLMYPETEFAHSAAQRVAHLTTDRMLAEEKERPRLVVKHYDDKVGLRGEVADPRPAQEEPPAQAARLVAHLNEYPEDSEAREQLARIYAGHYQRIDLARDQVEQLVASPGAGPKEIARWLNMLVDFHVAIGQDRAGAEEALRRVMDLYPKSAAAAQAESRLAYLEGEMRKNATPQAIKLGAYDDNIGLKGQVPKPPG